MPLHEGPPPNTLDVRNPLEDSVLQNFVGFLFFFLERYVTPLSLFALLFPIFPFFLSLPDFLLAVPFLALSFPFPRGRREVDSVIVVMGSFFFLPILFFPITQARSPPLQCSENFFRTSLMFAPLSASPWQGLFPPCGGSGSESPPSGVPPLTCFRR